MFSSNPPPAVNLLLFVQDATGSQQPYIDAARDQIAQIAVNLRKEGDFANTDDLRFVLIALRDHAGQDSAFVTQSFGFTSNMTTHNVIPCEPTLSGNYTEAHNFYKGLKTGGNFVPLGDAQPLHTIVTGCALKVLDTATLCARYQYIVQHQAFAQKRSVDSIAANFHARLSAEGVHHHHESAQSIYQHNEQGNRNVEIWAHAKTLHEAKQLIGTEDGKRIATAHSNNGIFAVTASGKAPITRDDVNQIVAKALLVGQSK
ncbi:hypothetical protein C8Q74DRAFT_1363931 [Fomes fomentarius]|nr:hypothetical protein C8Q74DRAFT_1363931 [Fomes fomentarius]